MKPKDKNRIYCVGARRPKLAFETEKKAFEKGPQATSQQSEEL